MIEDFIKNVFPKIETDILKKLLEILEELGVETIEDLQYVEPSELTPTLKIVQSRKLVKKAEKGKLSEHTCYHNRMFEFVIWCF